MDSVTYILQELKAIRRQQSRILDYLEGREGNLLLTTTQAAYFLGVSRQTISNKVKEGILHKTVRDGQKGFLLSDLKDYRNG